MRETEKEREIGREDREDREERKEKEREREYYGWSAPITLY